MIAWTLVWIVTGLYLRARLERRRTWFRSGAMLPSEDLATAFRRGRR